MKLLLLGPDRPQIMGAFAAHDDEVMRTEEPIHSGMQLLNEMDFLVSYGYRHIIKSDVLAMFQGRAINLHISLLPWNRGADPNLWSFLENTPKGVTIHAIDEGIDTGDILVQREVLFGDGETLASTYVRLNHEMCDLFVHSWAGLRSGQIKGVPQLPAQGSLHKLRDRDRFAHLLQRGWDTPVSELIGKAL